MKLSVLFLFIATVYGIDVARFLTNTGHGAAVRFGINSSTNASTVGSNGSIISSEVRNYPLDLTTSEPLSSARTELMADDGEPQTELGKKLKEHLDEIFKKIKDALENGKSFRDGLEKLKEIRQMLKDLKVEFGEKAKELIKKLREKLREYWQKMDA